MSELNVLRGVMSPRSYLSDPPSKRSLVPEPIELTQARRLYQNSVAARQDFITAVWHAHDAGHSNSKIASYVGMTEAGIRMLLKRHPRG